MSQYNGFGSNPYYSGGGYLQGGSPFSANASPSGMRKNETSHSLRPVTISQLAKATQPHTDAEWTVEGSEIGQVTLVAHVISIQVQTTNRVFWLDDGTGRIEARCWVDSTTEEEAEKWTGIQENTYLRVTGGLKTFGNKRYINALYIRPVKDPHEVYYHILETVHTSLILERGPPPPPGQKQERSGESSIASAYTMQSYSNDNMEQYNHLPPLQKAIIQFIIGNVSNAEGVHIAAIVRGVNADRSKIEFLMDNEPTIARRASDGMLRHVTIRQIKQAEQIHETAPLTIEGIEVSMLMVVANIFQCDVDGGDLRFNLDDGTGRIICRLRDPQVERVFEDFAYVRVILKQCRIRTYFEATYLNMVIDPNEIFYHSLKVIHDSLLYRKDDPATNLQPADVGAMDSEPTFNSGIETSLQSVPANDDGDLDDLSYDSHSHPGFSAIDQGMRIFEQEDMFMTSTEPSSPRIMPFPWTVGSGHTGYSRRSPSPDSPPAAHQDLSTMGSYGTRALQATELSLPAPHRRVNDPYGHLSNLQRGIILCLNNALEQMRSCTPRSRWDYGVHIGEIIDRLDARYTLGKDVIWDNLDTLIDEGYILTTIDDEHYNVT